MHVYMYVLWCYCWGVWTGGGRVAYGGARTPWYGVPPPYEIIGGPTAPPGPSPEVEVEKGRRESNEGKHFRKAVKKTDLTKIIRMTFTIGI